MTTMQIDRAVVEQALEALSLALSDVNWRADSPTQPVIHKAHAALRAALAQRAEPAQAQRCRAEPRSDGDFVCDCKIGGCPGRSAEPAQQAEPETCTWHQDGDSDSGVYATSCRHYFNLEDGTPEDNKMQWCCYCGKKLVQELITEGDDE